MAARRFAHPCAARRQARPLDRPGDTQGMILGDDGGAEITNNGGQTWTTQDNQPTAELYRVVADDRFPYWVYGGQQDNTTSPFRAASAAAPSPRWTGTTWAAGIGLDRFRPAQPRHRLRGRLRRLDHRYDHRLARRARSSPSRRWWTGGPARPEVPLPVERADHSVEARGRHALSRIAAPAAIAR